MRDISHEEKQFETFKSREAVNSAIIRNAPVGISVRDPVGNLLMYNRAWRTIWGTTEEEIRGGHGEGAHRA